MIKQINKIALSSWKNKLFLSIIFVLSCFILYSFLSDIYDTVQVVRLVHKDIEVKKGPQKVQTFMTDAQLHPSDIFGENQSSNRVNTSLTLEGVVLASDNANSAAIIAPQNGQSQLYNVGEEVLPGLKLEHVYHDYVVLNRSGVLEKLYIDWNSGSAPPSVSESTNPVTPVVPLPTENQNIERVREIQDKIRALPQFRGFDFKSIMRQRMEEGRK